MVKELQLISAKPFFYVVNVTEKKTDQELKKKILAIARIDGVSVIEVNCAFESELAQMTTAERKDFIRLVNKVFIKIQFFALFFRFNLLACFFFSSSQSFYIR